MGEEVEDVGWLCFIYF